MSTTAAPVVDLNTQLTNLLYVFITGLILYVGEAILKFWNLNRLTEKTNAVHIENTKKKLDAILSPKENSQSSSTGSGNASKD